MQKHTVTVRGRNRGICFEVQGSDILAVTYCATAAHPCVWRVGPRSLLGRGSDMRDLSIERRSERKPFHDMAGLQRYQQEGLQRPYMMRCFGVDHGFFSRRQRKQIERLALKAPANFGWEIDALVAAQLGASRRGARICGEHSSDHDRGRVNEADLHPQYVSWWKNTVWDDEASSAACASCGTTNESRVCGKKASCSWPWMRNPACKSWNELCRHDSCTQVSRSGREFTYIRHGTVNLLVGLNLHNGHMWAECLEKNDGEHFRPAIGRLLHPYSWAQRIHLIIDNGSSHISGDTTEFFESLSPRVHVLLTPSNASWLNQAEFLTGSLSQRYLIRGQLVQS